MFDRDLFKVLITEIAEARDKEIGCEDCFEQLDRFVETELSGLDAAHAMPLVYEHLEICGECREEFEAFLAALQTMEENPSASASLDRLSQSINRPPAS